MLYEYKANTVPFYDVFFLILCQLKRVNIDEGFLSGLVRLVVGRGRGTRVNGQSLWSGDVHKSVMAHSMDQHPPSRHASKDEAGYVCQHRPHKEELKPFAQGALHHQLAVANDKLVKNDLPHKCF